MSESSSVVLILPKIKEFHSAIHEVNVLAFGQANEARLVENLRKSRSFNAQLSLRAVEEGRVVSHLLFSPITVQAKKRSLPVLALAPLAVHPEFQNQGIGPRLVREGLPTAFCLLLTANWLQARGGRIGSVPKSRPQDCYGGGSPGILSAVWLHPSESKRTGSAIPRSG